MNPDHTRGWNLARQRDIHACHYCQRFFSKSIPPTLDHIIPSSQGGSINDGVVLACGPCNNARGEAPYREYMHAVKLARQKVLDTGTVYKRPKRRHVGDPKDGQYRIF